MSRTLHIQVQPDLVGSLDIVRLRTQLQVIATYSPLVTGYRFQNGKEDGDYYNFDFDTSRPSELWEKIRATVYDDSVFGQNVHRSSMAICTGRYGWDDYLLIHHWDTGEELDEVPAV